MKKLFLFLSIISFFFLSYSIIFFDSLDYILLKKEDYSSFYFPYFSYLKSYLGYYTLSAFGKASYFFIPLFLFFILNSIFSWTKNTFPIYIGAIFYLTSVCFFFTLIQEHTNLYGGGFVGKFLFSFIKQISQIIGFGFILIGFSFYGIYLAFIGLKKNIAYSIENRTLEGLSKFKRFTNSIITFIHNSQNFKEGKSLPWIERLEVYTPINNVVEEEIIIHSIEGEGSQRKQPDYSELTNDKSELENNKVEYFSIENVENIENNEKEFFKISSSFLEDTTLLELNNNSSLKNNLQVFPSISSLINNKEEIEQLELETKQHQKDTPESSFIYNNMIHENQNPVSDNDILSEAEKPKKDELEGFFDEYHIIKKLKQTFEEFSIPIQLKNISRGPSVTRYEFVPPPGLKLSRILNLQDNIALNLAAKKVRILAPIPGKSMIGIEIPNAKRELFSLHDILNDFLFKSEIDKNENAIPILLGKDISGNIIFKDLKKMPHLLIAGTTGSGKSTFLNIIISSLIQFHSYKKIRFLMIDTKRVELSSYNDIPHLLCPIITNIKEASIGLKWLVQEMENRYHRLEKHSCRDIQHYNQKIKKMGNPPLNYIIVIIDEFADLMFSEAKIIEPYIIRLAAMARAVGIHLILATQRPSVDVITGLIKANFPSRIAFQVSTRLESRIILDLNGADQLLGQGDFLFSGTSSEIQRIQSPHISHDYIEELVKNLKQYSKTYYIQDLLDLLSGEDDYNKTTLEDPLYAEALEIIIKNQKVSASYLQRKLKIGYNRAARIIEFMESNGIITPYNEENKSRKILIS